MIPEMKTFQNEISFSCQQFSNFQILMSSPGLYYTMNRRENRIVISKHNGHDDHLKKSYVKRRTVEVVRPNGSRKKVEIFVQAIECPYCKNRFVTLLELESKLLIEFCSCFRYIYLNLRLGHVKENHQSSLKPIHKCQYCDFCTLEKRLLETHLQQKHEEESVDDISKYVMTILQESFDSHLTETNHLEIEKKHEQRDINSNIIVCNNFEGEERLSECQDVVKPLKKVEEDKDDDFHGFYRFDCPYCDFIGFDQIEIGQHVIYNHENLQVERNAQTKEQPRSK